jgi:hypothetical protein
MNRIIAKDVLGTTFLRELASDARQEFNVVRLAFCHSWQRLAHRLPAGIRGASLYQPSRLRRESDQGPRQAIDRTI